MSKTIITKTLHAYAGRGWIAKITGRDPKYGLARAFLAKRDVTGSGNTYRDLEIVIEAVEGEVYEWSCQEAARRQEGGFWQVRDGKLVKITKADVLAAL